MKKVFYLLTVFLILSFQLLPSSFTEDKKIENLFEKNNFQGTFVLYDMSKDSFIGYNQKRAEKQFYPASTFKIYNSLIGLNTGVIKSVDEVFYNYKGEEVFLESWAQDSNLRYAIKVSQVPAYQLLARNIGIKKMKEEINNLNFGNKTIGNEIDKFWLQGPLKISAIEQCQLLAKLATNKLPYNEIIQKQVQEITVLEKNEKWTLHGKTGWATSNIETPVGWFVGWIEKDGKVYSFAINLDMKDRKDLPKREAMAKEALKILNII